jgi:hypothetical protein
MLLQVFCATLPVLSAALHASVMRLPSVQPLEGPPIALSGYLLFVKFGNAVVTSWQGFSVRPLSLRHGYHTNYLCSLTNSRVFRQLRQN